MKRFFLIIATILFATGIIGSIVTYLQGGLAFANQFNSKSEITMPVEFWYYVGFVALAVISMLLIWAIVVLWEDKEDKMMNEYKKYTHGHRTK